MRYLVASAIAASLAISAPALAQDTSSPEKPDSQTSQMKSSADGAGGMTMSDTATGKIKFAVGGPKDLTSSKLIGKNLYNKNNESIGEIEDLLISNGKSIGGVVVSVGGFLGMGERYVLVDPSSIFLHQIDGKLKAIVDADKDTLKNAAEFKYGKM